MIESVRYFGDNIVGIYISMNIGFEKCYLVHTQYVNICFGIGGDI